MSSGSWLGTLLHSLALLESQVKTLNNYFVEE
jgi:hypothetical protein